MPLEVAVAAASCAAREAPLCLGAAAKATVLENNHEPCMRELGSVYHGARSRLRYSKLRMYLRAHPGQLPFFQREGGAQISMGLRFPILRTASPKLQPAVLPHLT